MNCTVDFAPGNTMQAMLKQIRTTQIVGRLGGVESWKLRWLVETRASGLWEQTANACCPPPHQVTNSHRLHFRQKFWCVFCDHQVRFSPLQFLGVPEWTVRGLGRTSVAVGESAVYTLLQSSVYGEKLRIWKVLKFGLIFRPHYHPRLRHVDTR